MQLLKLGDRFINLDLVREFSFDASGALVWYDHTHATKILEHYEVRLLRRWLDAQALDIEQDGADAVPQLDLFALEGLDDEVDDRTLPSGADGRT